MGQGRDGAGARRDGSSGPRWAGPSAASLARASVWIASGALVLHPAYRAIGTEALASLGLPPWPMFYAAGLDVVVGAIVALRRPSRVTLALELALVAGFTSALAIKNPWLLAHPFGVLTKNIPFCALALHDFGHASGVASTWRWRILRVGLGAVWLTEGLVPKILLQQPSELLLVAESGLSFGAPAATLATLGAFEALSGVALFVLRGRALVLVLAAQSVLLVVLPVLVAAQDPLLLVHPFAPLLKNVPILVGTAILWRECSSSRC